jgi:hypothetical protein
VRLRVATRSRPRDREPREPGRNSSASHAPRDQQGVCPTACRRGRRRRRFRRVFSPRRDLFSRTNGAAIPAELESRGGSLLFVLRL